MINPVLSGSCPAPNPGLSGPSGPSTEGGRTGRPDTGPDDRKS